MASLTVRQLDEKLKKLLRLRAARHGRSMEDEVRVILRQAAEEAGLEALDLINPPNPPAQPVTQQVRTAAAAQKRVLLDHRRRHRRLQIARPDPAAARSRRARALHPHGGGGAFRHAARGRRARRRARLHRFVRRAERIRCRPYPHGARHRSDRGRAGDRGSDREDGVGAGGRSRDRGAARDRQADPARAGDEPAYVDGEGDATQSGAAARGRRAIHRTECGRDGRARRSRPRPHGRTARNRRGRRRDAAQRRPARRQTRLGHVGADQRTDSIRCACSPIARRASRATPLRRRPRPPAPT